MAVRKYRPNIYFAPGYGPELPSGELEPRFKHMGPVGKSIVTSHRIGYALTVLETFEREYPRSGSGARSEIRDRAINLLAAWLTPGADRHTLSDQLSDVLEELEMAITYLTPIYTVYGEYPRNSQFVGIWPDEDQIEESVESGELVRLYLYHGVAHPSDETAIADAMSDLDPEWSGHVLAVRVAGSKPKYQKLFWIFERSPNRLVWRYIEP